MDYQLCTEQETYPDVDVTCLETYKFVAVVYFLGSTNWKKEVPMFLK